VLELHALVDNVRKRVEVVGAVGGREKRVLGLENVGQALGKNGRAIVDDAAKRNQGLRERRAGSVLRQIKGDARPIGPSKGNRGERGTVRAVAVAEGVCLSKACTASG